MTLERSGLDAAGTSYEGRNRDSSDSLIPETSAAIDFLRHFEANWPCCLTAIVPDGAIGTRTFTPGFSDQAARYMGSVPKHLIRREGQVRGLRLFCLAARRGAEPQGL